MKKFIEEQLVYFPNGKRIIDSYVILAGDLFESVIIKNEIPMNEMPAVQLSALLLEQEKIFTQFVSDIKKDIIQAACRELGDAIQRCNVPSTEDLINATTDNPIDWDPISSFTKSDSQSDESFREQQFAIKICVNAIYSYLDIMNKSFTKNVIIAGFPGIGKTFTLMYVCLFVRSQGLAVISTVMMSHRAIQLGGWHWHKLLCIPVDRSNNMSVYRMTELALQKLVRYPNRLLLIKSINVIANDEIGQTPAEFDNVIDNILKIVCNINVH